MTEHHDHDEDAALQGLDLDAWAPPAPPPAGALADAVVARMRMAHPGQAARELGERAPRRRALIRALAGAAVVAVAAAGVIAIGRWGATRAPEAGRGEVFAARASHVELGGASSAELDPGAEVRWQRERRRISAAQPRGAALWRVDGDDTVVIDAGAAVASVEASGASLRVEVQMNRTDARVIGASAVTAVAVALVTVVVYQGHAKVTSAGQTVTVESGGAVEIRPQQPARHELTVGAAAPDVEQLKQELRELREQLAAAEQALAEKHLDETPPTPTPRRPPPPKGCNADELSDRGRESYAAGQLADALGFFEEAIACRPEPRLQQKAFIAACNLRDVAKSASFWARMPQALRTQAVNICLRNGITEEDLEAAMTPGKLRITSTPPAGVLVDGKEVGTSPVIIEVAPGRHKVTLVVGADKYTYTVAAKAGETVTVDKHLTNP